MWPACFAVTCSLISMMVSLIFMWGATRFRSWPSFIHSRGIWRSHNLPVLFVHSLGKIWKRNEQAGDKFPFNRFAFKTRVLFVKWPVTSWPIRRLGRGRVVLNELAGCEPRIFSSFDQQIILTNMTDDFNCRNFFFKNKIFSPAIWFHRDTASHLPLSNASAICISLPQVALHEAWSSRHLEQVVGVYLQYFIYAAAHR